MGIQLNGTSGTDVISAVDGSLTVEGLTTDEITSAGTLTFSTNNTARIKIANNSAATAIGTNAAYNGMLTVRGDISGSLLHLKATEDTSRLMVSGTDSNGCEVNLYDGAGGQKGILGVSSGEFFIKAPNSSAPMNFYTHNGSSIGLRLKINAAGDILLGTDQATIGCNTTDGSDNRSFSLCGGSDASQNRGSIITFYGNEANDGHSQYGSLYLRSGNTSTGIIGLWTQGNERFRITSDGKVSISSDGTADGLLTIKGDSDQVSTPSIRLLDGSDTREVSITNTSGDFVASVHGNDNAIHGHIKMFESGIFDINNGGASGSNTNRLRIASDGKTSIGGVQTTHTLGVTGGSSSQLLVKGGEADIWMTSTGGSATTWRILGSTGGSTHRFRIYDNTNGKEPFYIDGSSGTNTQHVHVNSGNLVLDAAGTGIDFSAQTASSASGVTTNNETLDHFEEGTWTPTQATIGSWASGAEIDGKYQRVGNWVTASFIVKYASNGSGHAASIDGLPFANNNSGSSYKQGGFVTYANNSNVKSFLIENGGSRIYIYNTSGSTIQLTSMDNVEVRGTVIYRVA